MSPLVIMLFIFAAAVLVARYLGVNVPSWAAYAALGLGAVLWIWPSIFGPSAAEQNTGSTTFQQNACGCAAGSKAVLRYKPLIGPSRSAGFLDCASALAKIASNRRYYISACA